MRSSTEYFEQSVGSYPLYEIWGCDYSDSAFSVHREDCFTFEEARLSCEAWRTGGRSAYVVEKDSGMPVAIGSSAVSSY